jgi:hypothetical protein
VCGTRGKSTIIDYAPPRCGVDKLICVNHFTESKAVEKHLETLMRQAQRSDNGCVRLIRNVSDPIKAFYGHMTFMVRNTSREGGLRTHDLQDFQVRHMFPNWNQRWSPCPPSGDLVLFANPTLHEHTSFNCSLSSRRSATRCWHGLLGRRERHPTLLYQHATVSHKGGTI